MTATTDIANLLYSLSSGFGMPVRHRDNNAAGPLTDEGRAVVSVGEVSGGGVWRQGFAQVNLIVPDLPGRRADLVRLNALERKAPSLLTRTTSIEGVPVRLTVHSTSLLEEPEMEAHYINVKILIQTLNTL